MDGSQAGILPLDIHSSHPVLSHEPLGRIVERRKTQLVLHLQKLVVRQWVFAKDVFVVLCKDMAEVVPEILERAQIIAEGPLRFSFDELFDKTALNTGF